MKKLLVLLGGFMLFASFLQAQTPRKPVEIEAGGGDPIGMMLASVLRDEIVKSPRYVLVSSTGGKSLSPAPWIIHLVTLDPDKSGNLTAAAVTITQGIIYWDSSVRICGAQKVQQCATSIFALLDKNVSASD